MAEMLDFQPRDAPEPAFPAVDLLLVIEPRRVIERFEVGLVEWCDMAMSQLSLAHGQRSSVGAWKFLADVSQSSHGKRAIDIEVVLDRARDFLETDQLRVRSGEPSLLGRVRRFGDAPEFEPGSLDDFLHAWSSHLWRCLASLLRKRRDPNAHTAEFVEATTRSNYQPPDSPRQVPIRREVWSGPPPDAVRSGMEEPGLQPEPMTAEVNELIAAIIVVLGSAASNVYFQRVHPSLDGRVLGVLQDGLDRNDKPATRSLQRTRIFVCWRRVYIAACLGEISTRFAGLHDVTRPRWARARKLTQALAALAREAMFEFEAPDLDDASKLERKRIQSRVYQEARRATGQMLFMLEQVLAANDQPELAAVFGSMLDTYRAEVPETPDHDPDLEIESDAP